MTRLRATVLTAALALLLSFGLGAQQLAPPPATITPAPAVYVNGTSAVPVLLPNGSAAAPAVAFTAEASSGLYRRSANTLTFSTLGGNFLDLNNANGYLEVGSGTNIAWSTTADATAARDLVLRRSAAKSLTLDTDGAGGALTLINLVTASLQQNGKFIPSVVASARATAQVAAVGSVATYTAGAADESLEVGCNVLVTTATNHSFGCTFNFTDEGSTARVYFADFAIAGGYPSGAAAVTNGNGAVPYIGTVRHVRVKAATAMTIATVGTFTTVTYNVEGIIKRVS